jgi:hypothetical protein
MKIKTTTTLLLIVGLAGLGPRLSAAPGSGLQRADVRNFTGDLHIVQPLPAGCATVDEKTPVTAGHLTLLPGEGRPDQGGRVFVLGEGTVTFAPFTLQRTCGFTNVTRDYTELAIQVSQAVSFLATPSGPDRYDFSVPVEDVSLYEAGTVNSGLEAGHKHPMQPVTGTIDLAAGTIEMEIVCASKVDAGVLGSADGTLTGTITGHIVFPDTDGDGVPDYRDNCPQFLNREQRSIASPILTAPPPITFGSCRNRNFGVAVAIDVCYADPVTVRNDAPGVLAPGPNTITWTATDTHDETAVARQIVTVVDRTPPLLRCEPTDDRRHGHGHDDGDDHDGVDDHDAEHGQADALRSANEAHGGLFRVTSRDACTAQPTIQLGRYVLANGELIQLTPIRQPGVTLVADPRSRFRHFLVGPGDAVVSSGDSSGNVASVTCPVALHHQASHHR